MGSLASTHINEAIKLLANTCHITLPGISADEEGSLIASWLRYENTICEHWSRDFDNHIQLLPLRTSRSEIFLYRQRYLWFIVWDQNYLHYLNTISYTINLADDELAKQWTRVWVTTYLLDRMLSYSPAHACTYHYAMSKVDLPPLESCSVRSEFPISRLGNIQQQQRLLCLNHEIAHMMCVGKVGFLTDWSMNARKVMKILLSIYQNDATQIFRECSVKESTHNVNFREQLAHEILASPGEYLEEFACDLWAIYQCIGLLDFRSTFDESSLGNVLIAANLLNIINFSLRKSRSIKLDEPISRLQNTWGLPVDKQEIYHALRRDFDYLAWRLAITDTYEISEQSDWIETEAAIAARLGGVADSIMINCWGGLENTPCLTEAIWSNERVGSDQFAYVLKTYGWK